MISFLKALFRRRNTRGSSTDTDLKGKPTRERWKNYASESGYVYQYVYRGYRALNEPPGRDFVFQIREGSSVRPNYVLVAKEAIDDVESRIGRKLMEQEIYAIAKLTLFRAFDNGDSAGATLAPAAEDMLEFLRILGRD